MAGKPAEGRRPEATPGQINYFLAETQILDLNRLSFQYNIN
jgi:hypothetical protein